MSFSREEALDELDREHRLRMEAERALTAYKDSFHGILDASSLADWHREHCGAIPAMNKIRDYANGLRIWGSDATKQIATDILYLIGEK